MNPSSSSRRVAAHVVSIALVGLTTGGCAEAPSPSSGAFEELVAAERAFAAASRADGMRAAFLANLAEGSIIFRPGPVDGRRSQEEAPPPPGTLNWYPERAEVSASGSFGYTTGPWEYTVEGNDPVYGHYVSVWQRQADGTLRVALDIGTNHPRPPSWSDQAAPRNSGENRGAGEGTRDELLDLDRSLAQAFQRNGSVEAYRDFGADDLTLYRNGDFPLEGAEAFEKLAENEAQILQIDPIGAGISEAGDLAYTYGTLQVQSEGTVEYRSYARIWRNQSGDWHNLVIDVEIPLPDPNAAGQP